MAALKKTRKINMIIERENRTMENKPLVTVIIPTYKRGWEYLNISVNSVLEQTYQNLEIIIIDDSPETYGNRHKIKEKMVELSFSDPRVRYLINEKNMGGSLARNRGIDAATGRYITFLDDDDEYLPEKVEHQVAFMEESDCDLSFENMVIYNNKGTVVDVREYKDIEKFDNDYLLRYHLMRHMTGTPTYMFKIEKLREIGGFRDAKMGQEFYLMLKAIQAGLKIRYLSVYDVKIYKHPDGGISSGNNKINGENTLYKFKQNFFPQLTTREKMFVRFRHYAVMVVAYLRNKRYLEAIGAGMTAFFVSPIDFFQQVFNFFKRIVGRRTSRQLPNK
jgi:glycosyltransferase involved in cell wall biosynthesis